jgi:hypothetical protein
MIWEISEKYREWADQGDKSAKTCLGYLSQPSDAC